MKPVWKTIERDVYDEDYNHPTGKETIHFLNLAENNRRVYCNLQITFAGENTIHTNLPTWHICLMNEFCETFVGTLEQAKEKAITYLPKVVDEAKRIINNYKLINEENNVNVYINELNDPYET
jgi:hypothetical protein